jgi:FkbM family methyltransferase
MTALFRPQYLLRPRRVWRRWRRRGPAPGRRRAALPWGLHLTVDAAETIGGSLWRQGLYDPTLTEALWRLTEPGMVALDGGANIGYTTLLLALRAGPTGQVHAFEPHPEIHHRLTENVEAASPDPRLAPVEIHRVALSDEHGAGRLVWDPAELSVNRGIARLEGDTPAGDRAGVAVDTLPLDALPEEALGEAMLLKLDLEGAEPAALRGARDLLAGGRVRHVVYEAHAGDDSPCHDLLGSHGYAVRALGYRLTGPVLTPLGEPPRLRPYDPLNYVATRDPDSVFSTLSARGWRSF